MNGKRLLVIVLVLGIILLNGCKKADEPSGRPTTTKVVVTTTLKAEESTTEATTEEVTTKAVTTTTSTTGVTTTAKATTTAAPTTTTTKAPTSGTFLSVEQEMLSQVNAERAKVGKSALTLSSGLNKCAQIRAKEIAESFSHTRPNGTSCFTVLDENGVSYWSCAENIAYGQSSVTNVMTAWMNSSGHKANILSENYDYTHFGCAGYSYGGAIYWVQLFIYE